MMEEREFFTERVEIKRASYTCPQCRFRAEYCIRWLRRTKKRSLPRYATDEDRMKFAKARDHLVRIDDELICQNPRCGRRFEIPSFQTVVFL